MSFTLINARPSPFGRKVAIALSEKGLAHEVRFDVPWSVETCTPRFSPFEQLPILICENGDAIYDSSYILTWLEARFPTPALLPAVTGQRLAAQKRQMLGERLMEIAQSLIFELHRPQPGSSWVDRQTRKLIGGFAEIERLYGSRAEENALELDLGDIAIATTALLFEFAVEARLSPPIDALLWRGRYPALSKAIAALENRPSFVTTRPQDIRVDLHATVS